MMAPPEATEMRWPSERVTAEPGVRVCEPIITSELESMETVWDPTKMGEGGAVVVGTAFDEGLESRVVEEAVPGFPVAIPVSVPTPWPVPVPVPVLVPVPVTPPRPASGDVGAGED
jgi:hypothetical protein